MLMQWICWILVWIEGKNGKPGKWTKVPINPMTGARASTTDPKTWGTIDQAVAGVSRWKCDGIGFVFSAEDPYVGIDIDDCRDPQTGVITADAMAIIERCGTFTEVSQSGTGVHAIGPGVVPVGGNRQGKLELYDHGRYFVVTGHPLPGYETIVDITEPLNEVHRETFTKPERPVLPQPLNALTLDDESILKGVRNTDKGRRLYDGDFAGYQSQSEADQALCNLLCVFGADRRQADDLFRRSGLFREKWDQRRGDKTYGEKTLDKAFDGTVRRRDVTPASVRAVPVLTAFPADTPCAAQVQALQDALAVSAQRVVELEAENARLTETVSFLVQLILDPDQTQAEKIATVSFAALVEAKRDRGEVAPDGTIAVSSAEISDDWRKAPETGGSDAADQPQRQHAPHATRQGETDDGDGRRTRLRPGNPAHGDQDARQRQSLRRPGLERTGDDDITRRGEGRRDVETVRAEGSQTPLPRHDLHSLRRGAPDRPYGLLPGLRRTAERDDPVSGRPGPYVR
jgi:putative DNA primase/helicase